MVKNDFLKKGASRILHFEDSAGDIIPQGILSYLKHFYGIFRSKNIFLYEDRECKKKMT